ncbi:MAG: hypothetical protein M3011_05695 [Actinomycetota bacterium]|nr:hypothetical protein [Actinomycetota bacterium]
MSEGAWHRLYLLLAAKRMPRPVLGGALGGEEDDPGATLSVAWPDLQVGLATDGDDAATFDRAGWRVIRLTTADVDAYGRVLDGIGELAAAGGGTGEQAHIPTPKAGLAPLDQAWLDVYRLLAAAHLPRPVLACPAADDTPGGPAVSVGWPGLRLALAVETDAAAAFERAGWTVVRLVTTDMEAYGRVLEAVEATAMWGLLAESRLGARRRVSEPEQVLLRAFVDAGLPPAERNLTFHRRADGTGRVLGVPDFAWGDVDGVDIRVILEVDGFYFHAGRQMAAELATAAESDPQRRKQLIDHARLQVAKDAHKRRVMAERGWLVLVVHDTELDSAASVAAVAESVRRVIQVRRGVACVAP